MLHERVSQPLLCARPIMPVLPWRPASGPLALVLGLFVPAVLALVTPSPSWGNPGGMEKPQSERSRMAGGASGNPESGRAAAGPGAPSKPSGGEAAGELSLSSPSFESGGAIPSRHTCEDEDVSPALRWSGLPANCRSLALIVDDPDAPDPRAPKTTWVHWVLYNLPPDSAGLGEGVASTALPAGTLEGVNDWKRTGYGGPCPPVGRHRYYFKLYALDVALPDLKRPNKARLVEAMQGHILARTELMGTYQERGR